MILLVLLSPLAVQAQTIMIDRTGSMANQSWVEDTLYEVIPQYAHLTNQLNLLLFSEHPLSTPAIPLQWPLPSRAEPTFFRPLQDARLRQLEQLVRDRLRSVLATKSAPALCTSVPAILKRATLETKPVLVVTDADHDCPPYEVSSPFTGGRDVIIVLIRSKFDSGDELQILTRRQQELNRLLPDARIFLQPQLEQAVEQLMTTAPSGRNRRAKVSL